MRTWECRESPILGDIKMGETATAHGGVGREGTIAKCARRTRRQVTTQSVCLQCGHPRINAGYLLAMQTGYEPGLDLRYRRNCLFPRMDLPLAKIGSSEDDSSSQLPFKCRVLPTDKRSSPETSFLVHHLSGMKTGSLAFQPISAP
jgi:hypothetical protein